MSGKRYRPEEIISKLREAEVYLAEGVSVGEVIRRLGVTKITYYRWRREYGGMKVDQAKRLKDLERENARLKRLLADAEIEMAKADIDETRRQYVALGKDIGDTLSIKSFAALAAFVWPYILITALSMKLARKRYLF